MTVYRVPNSQTCLTVGILVGCAVCVMWPVWSFAQDGEGSGSASVEAATAVAEISSDIVLDESEAVIPEELEDGEAAEPEEEASEEKTEEEEAKSEEQQTEAELSAEATPQAPSASGPRERSLDTDMLSSSDGAFRYSVPVMVPEFLGLQPNLDLSYNSSSASIKNDDSYLGFGWSLPAFSTIDRRSAEGEQAKWDDSKDGFFLDGQLLLRCSGQTFN